LFMTCSVIVFDFMPLFCILLPVHHLSIFFTTWGTEQQL
jgi:hypothetical protein